MTEGERQAYLRGREEGRQERARLAAAVKVAALYVSLMPDAAGDIILAAREIANAE